MGSVKAWEVVRCGRAEGHRGRNAFGAEWVNCLLGAALFVVSESGLPTAATGRLSGDVISFVGGTVNTRAASLVYALFSKNWFAATTSSIILQKPPPELWVSVFNMSDSNTDSELQEVSGSLADLGSK